MARIRTIKPEFFKHSGLFDLEQETALPIRLAFAGLWTCSDRDGRFKWRPRELKIDILPYDECDFSRVLDALETRGYIVKYASGTEHFGYVPTWTEHQFINNKEPKSGLPNPPENQAVDVNVTREPRVEDVSDTRGVKEGKGKEGKGKEGKGKEGEDAPPARTESTLVRPGSNGEFMAATWLLQELGIASHASDISVVAQVIAFEARNRGEPMMDAAYWISEQTRKKQGQGEHVTVFWLKDRKFALEVTNGTTGTNQPSATKQRVDGARRVLAEIAIKRGLYDPVQPVGSASPPVPEPGSNRRDTGVHEGLREVGPEVLPPQGRAGNRGFAH